ncbi:MAG: alcohol dehydrogenase catalytic domain-containing protein [Phycisphaerae bacterium]|nr:alcohol dehydrogenase catalytic domain-containing protein [Phycisphaerae bacterium]
MRLRTRLGGVCGTDLALVALRNHPNTILQQYASFPAVLGHENVAEIVEIGSAVSGWHIGQRVCVDPAVGCQGRGISPPCRACTNGVPSVCESPGGNGFPPRALLGLNSVTGGSWAEYFVAHASQLHATPEGIPDETAVLVDPIASAAHAVLRRRPQPGEDILVHGSGIISIGVIASIRTLGHDNRVTAIVRHQFQGELARRYGADKAIVLPRRTRRIDRYKAVAADTNGIRMDGRMGNQSLIGGYELTYDCSGNAAGLVDALMWTRGRGTLVAVGTTGIAMHDSTPIWFDELSVIGASGRQIEQLDGRRIHTYDLVFEWLQSGRLDLSALPQARYPLSRYREGLAALLNRSRRPIMKVVFDPRE